jgi:hypothetical protein
MRRLCVAALGAILVSAAAAAPYRAQKPILLTKGPLLALAADGGRAAFVVGVRHSPCASVHLWEPFTGRVFRLQRACGRHDEVSNREGTLGVALAGTQAAWVHAAGGNFLETTLFTATLAHPKPLELAAGVGDDVSGTFARSPAGDGSLLAFTFEHRCDSYGEMNGRPEDQCPPGRKTGDVIAATVVRTGGSDPCPDAYVTVRQCAIVAKSDRELSVLAVDAGRIAARTSHGVRLFMADGSILADFPGKARAAALSGNRLAVRTAGAIEIYDIATRRLVKRIPARGVRKYDPPANWRIRARPSLRTHARPGSPSSLPAGERGSRVSRRPTSRCTPLARPGSSRGTASSAPLGGPGRSGPASLPR